MDLEELRNYCLSKKNVTESFPFDDKTLVYKVFDKIFAITGFDLPLSINLKCDPEKAMELREKYSEVKPGYHMNKKHWNTVNLNGKIPRKEVLQMIDESYELVLKGVKKSIKTGKIKK